MENTSVLDVNTSCYGLLYDTDLFKAVAAIRTGVAIFSFTCCIIIILLICCYQKYNFFPQRLILYLAVVSAVHSLVFSVSRINYHSTRQILDVLCEVNGFAELYSSWVELLLIACVTVHLFLLLIYGIETSRWEVLHLLVSFLAPLLWCWAPYIHHSFGSSGPWCGIRVHSTSNCTRYTLGIIFRFVLWHIPLYTFFLTFFLICLTVILCKLKKEMLEWENPNTVGVKRKVFRQMKPLLVYPLVFLLLKLPLLINQLYECVLPLHPRVGLWLMEAIISPLGGAVIALVYVCDTNTRNKLRQCLHCHDNPTSHCCWCIGEGRRTRASTKVDTYPAEIFAQFGDSLEGERMRVHLRQQARLEEILVVGIPNPMTRSSSS